jgi:transposase, IS6 family
MVVDQTYVKLAGRWTYRYRAIDQHGQVIDVLVTQRRDAHAARAFFTRALTSGPAPVEITTARAPVDPRVIDDSSRPRAMSSSSTRTTGWKPITADLRPGCGQCAA